MAWAGQWRRAALGVFCLGKANHGWEEKRKEASSWLPTWPLRAWGWVWGIRAGGEDLKLSVTSATLPAASLWIHTSRKEACNSDSCSSQNLFFIKMLCAAWYGGVKLICLWECVCLERTIRYFVFFKIILRDGLYKVSLFLPYIAACRNGARRRDHLPCWEWPWCTRVMAFPLPGSQAVCKL